MKELAPHGVIALPLGKSPRAAGYQAAGRPLSDGEAWDYRVAITRPEHAATWSSAWEQSDDDTIGQLLGTPDCCRRFFDRVWKQERWFDTTVPMAAAWDQNARVNMLWRWLGARPVSHLPCSPSCVESSALAHKCRQLLPEPARG